MVPNPPASPDASAIAVRWCQAQGPGWNVLQQLGVGGTAPVFELASPHGLRALKIYDLPFSSGERGEIERHRIQHQLTLRDHTCPSLVQVYDGGTFEDRLYLLMSRAPGTELHKQLPVVPRTSIRDIVDQVARACLFLSDNDLCHRDIKAANIFVSDDFRHATLLDISVIRDIRDPIGAGTDRDGQLPVLATTRYTPPEYLFRLLEPSPALWHALTIYQLGALLHDLIMRVPLFQAEYEQSATNRYRFAWLAATRIPPVAASDVDQDIVFLANRALDKDWERRSVLRITDFLHDAANRQHGALHLLGLAPSPLAPRTPDLQAQRRRLDSACRTLEAHLVGYLRKNNVTATHQISPGLHGDASRTITLRWDVSDSLAPSAAIALNISLRYLHDDALPRFVVTASLSRRANDIAKEARIRLPEVSADGDAQANLATQAEAAFCALAKDLSAAQDL